MLDSTSIIAGPHNNRIALAYAELSLAQGRYHHLVDGSEERKRMVKLALDRAVELGRDVPQVHLALGMYYYRIARDFERALKELAVARKGMPNNAEMAFLTGIVLKPTGC